MKTSDDLRPPSSIYSHSYKFLYKQTGYKNFVPKSGNSIFYTKWTSTILLHAVRITGSEKIFCQRIVKNSAAFYFPSLMSHHIPTLAVVRLQIAWMEFSASTNDWTEDLNDQWWLLITYDPRRRSTLIRINFYTSRPDTRISYLNSEIQLSTQNGPSTFYHTT